DAQANLDRARRARWRASATQRLHVRARCAKGIHPVSVSTNPRAHPPRSRFVVSFRFPTAQPTNRSNQENRVFGFLLPLTTAAPCPDRRRNGAGTLPDAPATRPARVDPSARAPL